MGLETATFINGLNSSNPVGATDPKSQGDDHIRLLKATILATFAAITGAVTASHTQINQTCVGTGGTFPAINASALTNLNGSAIASGTVPDARLSANVPLLNATNTFSAASLVLSNAASPAITVTDTTNPCTSFLQSIDAAGLCGTTTNHPFSLYTNNVERLQISNGGNFDFKGGTVTTNNAAASEVGYKGTPVNSQSGNYTLVLTDAGKTIQYTGSGGHTFTIPANASVAFPIGTVITLAYYGASSSNIIIAITTDTLYLAGANFVAGSRTLVAGGIATLYKNDATHWTISGNVT